MRRETPPTPVQNKGSKPYRIYADPYGDSSSRLHRPVTEAMMAQEGGIAPNLPAWRVLQLVEEQQLPGIAVVDDKSEIIGLVRRDDLISAPRERAALELTHHALSLPVWTPICKAAAIMASEAIDLAAVVDYDRHVLGLLSALDIARWLAMQEGYIVVRNHH